MMKPAEVSVIMPCYNAGSYIGTAIESVLGQAVPVQLVIVDDGSTDDSLGVINRYAGKVVVLQSDHRGVAHARNRAIGSVSADYILLLDADDALAPGCLKPMLGLAAGGGDTVVYANFSSWDKTLQRRLQLHKVVKLGGNPLSLLAKRNISPPGAVLFPSESFARVGEFDQEVAGCEDWDFLIRLARAGYRFHRLNKEVFYYRRLPLSASNQAGKMLVAGLTVIDRVHSRDNRITGDIYAEGYRPEQLELNRFNYHAPCLASALFSADDDTCGSIIRSIIVPTNPDWMEFGRLFRMALRWNAMTADLNLNQAMMQAQLRCMYLVRGNLQQESWHEAMINNILFPYFRDLLFRPGPKKAIRLFQEWNMARNINSIINR